MIDYKYLFYYARSQKESFIRKGKGGAQPNISQEIIKAHKIPLPPLPEQHRIVARIESLFGKLDEAKEKLHAVIDGYEPREAAILHQAFTGELSKSWREECGERLGGWENRLLGEYLEPLETKKPAGDFFRYIDIDSVDNQCQAVREPKLLAVRDAPSRASRGLREHDVLFSMVRPYLKNIACVDAGLADCIASTGFYVCRCREGLLPAYLYQFLCSGDAINYLMQYMKGDNSPAIRKDDLLKMPVCMPCLEEQIYITGMLNSLLKKERQAKSAAQTALAQIPLIKKAILARAFRGELGTNDPAEECGWTACL